MLDTLRSNMHWSAKYLFAAEGRRCDVDVYCGYVGRLLERFMQAVMAELTKGGTKYVNLFDVEASKT